MASNLRRVDNLQNIKTRELWMQDTSGTYAQPGSLLYMGYDGRVLTKSHVYVSPPGSLVVPDTVTTNELVMTGECASIHSSSYIKCKWIKQMGNFNTVVTDVDNTTQAGQITSRNLRCVACDKLGNIIVTYTTIGSVPTQVNSGGMDIVVAKFNTDGDLLWITQSGAFNTPFDDTIPAITLDEEGFIYISFTTTFPEKAAYFKLNKDSGVVVWSASIPVTNGVTSTSIHTHKNNVFITASLGYLGPGPIVTKNDAISGTTGAIAANFNRNSWEVTTATSSTHLYSLMCDFNTSSGTIAITNLHIAKMDLVTNVVVDGATDALFNPTSWDVNGIPQFKCGSSITIGPDNNIVLCYLTTSNTPSTIYSGAGIDMVVAKLDSVTLSPIWLKQFSTGFTDVSVLTTLSNPIGTSVTTDSIGNIYTLYTTSAGNIDLRITLLSHGGNILSTITPPLANTPLPDYIPSISWIPGTQDIAIAYRTDGQISGGVQQGGGDLVVARYTLAYNFSMQPEGGAIGIGTCEPEATLDVVGDIHGYNLFAAGPQGGGYRYISKQGSYVAWNNFPGSGYTSFNCQRGAGYGGFIFTIHDTTDPASDYIQPLTVLHTTKESEGSLNLANTRVGVNTSNPQFTFDVDGSARINTVPAYANPGGLTFTAGNYGGQIYASSNDPGFTPSPGLDIGLQIDARNFGTSTYSTLGVRCSRMVVSNTADISGSVIAHDANGAFGLYSSGTASVPFNATTYGPISVPGMTTSGRVMATFQSNPGAATKLWVEPGTNQFTINLDTQPTDLVSAVNIGWLVVKL